LGVFLQFTMQAATHNSVVTYAYTSSQLLAAGIIDASRLRIALFDSACSCYRIPSTGGSVNVATRVITQSVAQTNGQIPQCAVVWSTQLGAAVNGDGTSSEYPTSGAEAGQLSGAGMGANPIMLPVQLVAFALMGMALLA
jgi:hypothetical protein